MPQLSLYLGETEMTNLRDSAAHEGVSLSRYARSVLNKSNATNSWSSSFLSTFGAVGDSSFETPEELPWSPLESWSVEKLY